MSLTPVALDDLRTCLSLHRLARIAANPGAEISHTRQSMLSGIRKGYQYGVERKGLRMKPDRGEERLIRWSEVRAHVDRYVTEEWRDDFRRIDYIWCRALSGDVRSGIEPRGVDDPNGYRFLLDHLIKVQARTIWTPADTIDTEAEQLDLFAL